MQQQSPAPIHPARRFGGALALSLALLPARARAEEPGKPPPYKMLRAEEDYSYLRDPTRRTEVWDALKYVPLDGRGAFWLSFGGDIRQRYEFFNNPVWGTGTQDRGSWLQRYMAHADLHLGPHVRVFAQMKSGIEFGRAEGPRGIDEDLLDVHQAFVEVAGKVDRDSRLALRVGRQELQFGSSRLVSVREGPNVRVSFDGARLDLRSGRALLTAFATRAVDTLPGVLDDGWGSNRWFGGAYLAAPKLLGPLGVDVYSFYFQRPDAAFDRGKADEARISLGTRLFGQWKVIDWNFEGVYQIGTFGAVPIRAFTIASDTGVSAKGLWGRPRLGLRAALASGDGRGRTLGTFNALFPRGAYFGEEALVGPANFYDVHPTLDVSPHPTVTVTLEWDRLWRFDVRDGLYDVAGRPRVPSITTSAPLTGDHLAAGVTWAPERHWTFFAYYGRFFAGPFLVEAGRSRDIDFFATYASFRF